MSYASIHEAMIYGTGVERGFRCHVHDEQHASASINSITGLWYCYACGAKGKYNAAEVPSVAFARNVQRILDKAEHVPTIHPERWLDIYDSLGPGDYWLSRFTEAACRAHRLGQDLGRRFATIPVRDRSGHILGVIRRDLTGNDPAKYRYPWGVNVSECMYGYHRASGDALILTEGATDAIAAEEAGWPDAVASYRNGLSKAQVAMIAQYQPSVVLVAYDQDEAGERGAEQVTRDLARICRVDRLWWEGYKDLASIPLSERSAMLQEVTEKTVVRTRQG